MSSGGEQAQPPAAPANAQQGGAQAATGPSAPPPAAVPQAAPQAAPAAAPAGNILPIQVQRHPNGALAAGFLRRVGHTVAAAAGLRAFGGVLMQVTPDARMVGPVRSVEEMTSFIGSACTPMESLPDGTSRPLRGEDRAALARLLLGAVDPSRYFPPVRSVTAMPQLLRRNGPNGQRHAWQVSSGYEPMTETEFRLPAGLADTLHPYATADGALQVEEAKAELMSLVADFPMASAADRSVWLASLLTVLCRRSIDGPAPLFMFDANQSGTGKSLLARTVRELTGARVPTVYWGQDLEENRKMLLSVAKDGVDGLLLDNLAGRFGDVVMDQLLTSTTVNVRVLGGNTNAGVYVGGWTLIATGNNVVPRADVARRLLRCLIVNSLPPGTPRQFRHRNLLEHIRTNRAHYLRCALTLVQAWVATGSPAPPADWVGFPSFEAWTDVVRGLLAFLGEPDVFATDSNHATVLGDEDGETEQQRAAVINGLAAVLAKRGRQDMTSAEIMAALSDVDVSMDPRVALLMAHLKNVTSLPYLLRTHAQAHHKGLQLTHRRSNGERRWTVKRIYADVVEHPAMRGNA